MRREFNDTGSCNPRKHYMADITAKFEQVKALVDRGKYFVINRPRQYGKTTMLYILMNRLVDQYRVIGLSFEGVGDASFATEERFVPTFLEMIADSYELSDPETSDQIRNEIQGITDFQGLSRYITRFVRESDHPVVLLIDEVDESSNSQVFLKFLGLLRKKYLAREQDRDITFQSVILAGLYDVTSLKLKIRKPGETQLNSPWNIAAPFEVNMTLSTTEIVSMLKDFAVETGNTLDTQSIADRIHYYTNGHPFLVSTLCKIVDEQAETNRTAHEQDRWDVEDIDWAFRWLTRESYSTTNFDVLVKTLENNPDLYELTRWFVFNGKTRSVAFTNKNPLLDLGRLHGLYGSHDGNVVIHNRIYEQVIADYMRSKQETSPEALDLDDYVVDRFVSDQGRLALDKVFHKFQSFMAEHYSDRDAEFIEREGRLLFMSFLKPIINGSGFMFKEPVVGDERRMDLVVTFGDDQKEVVELKIWRGESYHEAGLQQLSDYLDFQGLKSGYLLIFDFRKDKQVKTEAISFKDKSIVAAWV